MTKMVHSECEDKFPSSFGNYQPWLIQLHGRKKGKQEFMNPYNNCTEERKIPQLEGKLCLGCFGEWLLLADESTKETFFLHLTLNPKYTVHLPSLCEESFEFLGSCIVSASPTSHACMVIFVGRRNNNILYCRPHIDTSWTKVSIPIGEEPHNFTGQAVRCKGMIYALHGCVTLAVRVVVINELSLLMGHPTWTIIEVPVVISGCYWRHLVVSGKDIFLVSVAISFYRGNPVYYSIHLLETSDQSWKRVKSISGRVFFLGGIHSSALSATQAGTQHDCIYVVNIKYGLLPGEGIYRICIQDQTIRLSLLLNRPKDIIWYKLCWVMPTKPLKNKLRTLRLSHSINTNKHYSTYFVHNNNRKEERCKIDISRPWADMPIELVELLLERLYLVDSLHLPCVCKAWKSLSNPTEKANKYPWLMFTAHDSCMWRLFDPVYEKEYSIDMKWLGFSEDLTFHYSKDGWVLASKEEKSLFLINPLTRECVGLPDFKGTWIHKKFAFSSAPTSPDCVVIIAERIAELGVEISTWSPSEEQWSSMEFYNDFGRCVPCNPVFIHGEFYWYRIGGELVVFNPYKKVPHVLKMKAPIEMVLYRRKVMECRLVDSGGDLITVFRGRTTDPIRIFKSDRLNMAWSELHDMGGVTIFLDRRTTLATSCLEKLCHNNQIYLSGFSDSHCKSSPFYSLKTTEYQPKNCSDINEPKNCIWIEPSLTTNRSNVPRKDTKPKPVSHK
ncbi:F-box protein family-like [Rhynchospora pubera]|uniref:F-box protein family-like n=1 Tax=Rhynchospora pubera TaxID=906938 RepID=A0AAV8D4B5_9POAL|nr:F-box protein family-like [Rhynchospora pubera]